MESRIGLVAYNLDRAVASLIWRTSQETISSQVGRIARGERQVGEPLRFGAETRAAKLLSRWLDNTPCIWGVDHTKRAIEHANALDKVDDGMEQ